MTARNIFEAMLIELSKVNAPSLLLEDFNYLFNKAINQYINKRYSIYDVNQQTTDDLRVLKASAKLTPRKSAYCENNTIDDLYNATYEIELPYDYMHMLNCICVFKVKQRFKCYNAGTHFKIGAKRLTSDAWSNIITDYYNRPTYRRPYFYIHNVNHYDSEPYDVYNPEDGTGTDQLEEKVLRNIHIDGTNSSGLPVTLLDEDLIFDGSSYRILNPNSQLLNISTVLKTSSSGGETGMEPDRAALVEKEVTKNTPLFYSNDKNDRKLYFISKAIIDNKDTLTYFTYNKQTKQVGLTTLKTNTDVITVGTNDSAPEFPRQITLKNSVNLDLVDKTAYTRHSNQSKVLCEIRYGSDDSIFTLEKVIVDYIKSPQHIRLTQEQLDQTLDTSQVMEYPDYVCQEIINELVTIVMENTNDPRLSNHISVSKSIPDQAPQQTTQPQQ